MSVSSSCSDYLDVNFFNQNLANSAAIPSSWTALRFSFSNVWLHETGTKQEQNNRSSTFQIGPGRERFSYCRVFPKLQFTILYADIYYQAL